MDLEIETVWKEQLRSLTDRGRFRRLRTCTHLPGGRARIGDREYINLSSNDYLGLAENPMVLERARRALEEFGPGARASRLVTGDLPIHRELETRLAHFKNTDTALSFSSGYHANLGIITSLAGSDFDIFSDELNHASIVDGCRLSRASVNIYPHLDLDGLAGMLEASERRKLVITEGVFSMDGDMPDLGRLTGLCRKHAALLMVDDAHGTGVLGEGGRGSINARGIDAEVQVSMGTLSKALASQGGFACTDNVVREVLVNQSRSLLYTTALAPSSAGAALGALDVMENDPDMGKGLLERARWIRESIQDMGLDTLGSQTQIIPVLAGRDRTAVSLSEKLLSRGVLAPAMRPPTVKEGQCRLRLSVCLSHDDSDLERTLDALSRTAAEVGLK